MITLIAICLILWLIGTILAAVLQTYLAIIVILAAIDILVVRYLIKRFKKD